MQNFQVIKKERPSGLLCTFGGQTALNCAVDLYESGILEQYEVAVLGTPIEAIKNTEDRERFKQEVEKIGEKVAPCRAATTVEEAAQAAEEVGFAGPFHEKRATDLDRLSGSCPLGIRTWRTRLGIRVEQRGARAHREAGIGAVKASASGQELARMEGGKLRPRRSYILP